MTIQVTSAEHNALARSLAGQSTVLLQNFGILPLNRSTVGAIAVLGVAAYEVVISGGEGSGNVIPYYHVSALEGIVNHLGAAFPTSYTNAEKSSLPPLPPNVFYDNGVNTSIAAAVAAKADVAIVVVAVDSTEGLDRPNLHFTGNQDDLVYAVAAAQPNTVGSNNDFFNSGIC